LVDLLALERAEGRVLLLESQRDAQTEKERDGGSVRVWDLAWCEARVLGTAGGRALSWAVVKVDVRE